VLVSIEFIKELFKARFDVEGFFISSLNDHIDVSLDQIVSKTGHNDSEALVIAEFVKVVCDVDEFGDKGSFIVDFREEEDDEKSEIIEMKARFVVRVLDIFFILAGFTKIL